MKYPKRLYRAVLGVLGAFATAAYACVLPSLLLEEEQPEEAPAQYALVDTAQERLRALETYAQLARSSQESSAERERAREEIAAVLGCMEQELHIEEQLLAAGLGKSSASVSEGFVCVIMEAFPDGAQAALAFEIICGVTGCSPGDIRLIPLNAP